MKNPRHTQAASEIVGEILLLAIAVATVSVIYLQVLSTPGPPEIPTATIIGKIEDGCPVFELQRGASLGPDTRLYITLAGYDKREFVQSEIGNQQWKIGERIVIPVEDITGVQVEATIVDTKTNSVVFWGVLQEGMTTQYKGGIWHFDEVIWRRVVPDDVKDSSTNNNHGTPLGNAKIINGTLQPQNVKSNNSGYFSGFLDAVKVKTSWTLNITQSITIEAWMKPQIPNFISDIVGVSGAFGYTPYIVHVAENRYAVVSEDKQKVALLSTVAIDQDGFVEQLSSVTFGSSTGSNTCQPKIVRMTEKICIVSFIDNKYLLDLQSANISNDGSISLADQIKFPEKSSTNQPNRPSLLRITDNLLAVAYWAPNDGGLLKTVNISSIGKMTYTGKMIQYDPVSSGTHSREPHLVHVAGNVFALAYRGPSNRGILKTFVITSTGEISYTGNMVEFETTSAYEPGLIHVADKVFAVVYRNNLNYGMVKTFSIFPNGFIMPTGNAMVFEDTQQCFDPYIIHGQDDMYIIVYATGSSTAASAKGFIINIRLEPDGSISPIPSSRKQFQVPDGITCHYPVIVPVAEQLYAIAYTGPGSHNGYLITILIGQHGRGIYKGKSYMLYANTTMVEGYINNVYVSYYNNSFGSGWNHFALTYDRQNIRLYVNGNLVNELSYPNQRILITKDPLYFGRFYCGYVDEIAIYDTALTQEQLLDHYLNPGMFEYRTVITSYIGT